MRISKGLLSSSALLTALLFTGLLSARGVLADTVLVPPGLTFGPSNVSDFALTGISNFCFNNACYSGLALTGGALGTDSFGNPYALGGYGTFFMPTGSSTWSDEPTCAAPVGCAYDNDIPLSDKSETGYFAGGDDVTLSQASNGAITLDLTACFADVTYLGVATCVETGNIVFVLQVDPLMLADLQPGQTVDLTVVGGCVTTSTSCGSGTTGSTTPEPGTLLLLGSGLMGLGFIRRKFAGV